MYVKKLLVKLRKNYTRPDFLHPGGFYVDRNEPF